MYIYGPLETRGHFTNWGATQAEMETPFFHLIFLLFNFQVEQQNDVRRILCGGLAARVWQAHLHRARHAKGLQRNLEERSTTRKWSSELLGWHQVSQST
jgi:hypothetical protein